MAVSRTLSFVVGLALAGMAAFAALGADTPPSGPPVTANSGTGNFSIANHPIGEIDRDISARLDRVEKLLLEMCERTARFAGCEELRKQR